MKNSKVIRVNYPDGIAHGTIAGYREHRRRINATGIPTFTPCDACRWQASLGKAQHGVRARREADGSMTVTWHYPWEARIAHEYVRGA